MAGNVRQPNGRHWSHHNVSIQPNPGSHQSSGCTGMWQNPSGRFRLIKTAPGPQARTTATALTHCVYVSVPHTRSI